MTTPPRQPSPPPPPPPPVHPNITLHPPTALTLQSLKRLNTLLLPIPYPASFYTEILPSPLLTRLTRLAFYRPAGGGAQAPVCVGAIRCKLDDARRVYIMTLCTLSPYRGLGVGSRLLESVVGPGVGEVYAHVWEANEEALEWYYRRGFTVEKEVVEGYYRRLRPGGARVVRRVVRPSEMVGREPVVVVVVDLKERGSEGQVVEEEEEGEGGNGERRGMAGCRPE